MKRNIKIPALCLTILCAGVAAVFSFLLIQNYRGQFDTEMTYADMTNHVRAASVALSVFILLGAGAAWSLVHLLRRPRP
jgi:hypothetical protein